MERGESKCKATVWRAEIWWIIVNLHPSTSRTPIDLGNFQDSKEFKIKYHIKKHVLHQLCETPYLSAKQASFQFLILQPSGVHCTYAIQRHFLSLWQFMSLLDYCHNILIFFDLLHSQNCFQLQEMILPSAFKWTSQLKNNLHKMSKNNLKTSTRSYIYISINIYMCVIIAVS